MSRWKSNLRKLRGRRANLRRERVAWMAEQLARVREIDRRRKAWIERTYAERVVELELDGKLTELLARYGLPTRIERDGDNLTLIFESPLDVSSCPVEFRS